MPCTSGPLTRHRAGVVVAVPRRVAERSEGLEVPRVAPVRAPEVMQREERHRPREAAPELHLLTLKLKLSPARNQPDAIHSPPVPMIGSKPSLY